MATQRSKGPRRIGKHTIRIYQDAALADAGVNEMLGKGWKILDGKIVPDESGTVRYVYILFLPYDA
jgi:hypothetical protein